MGEEKRAEVEKALLKKGFRQSNAGHRQFMYYTLSGKKTSVWTLTSHGSDQRDLSQCELSYSQFRRLVECPLSREEYEGILVSNQDICE